MSDNSDRNDEPELRMLLNQIHGETGSVLDNALDLTQDERDLKKEPKSSPGKPDAEALSAELEAVASAQFEAIKQHQKKVEPPAQLEASQQHQKEADPTIQSEASQQHPKQTEPPSTVVDEVPAAQLEAIKQHQKEAEPIYAEPPENLKHDLQNLPVTLDCTLRSLQKTLGEVSQIQEGEIITLSGSIESPIQLKVNGKVFAQGRIVMADGHLAIEVIQKFE